MLTFPFDNPGSDAADGADPSALIVDDDSAVLGAVEISLGRANLVTHGTADPVNALRLIRRHTFHLLVTDIRMPSMSGIELATHARAVQPWISVLFMTGLVGALDSADEHAVAELGAAITRKPLRSPETAMVIGAALDRARIAALEAGMGTGMGMGAGARAGTGLAATALTLEERAFLLDSHRGLR